MDSAASNQQQILDNEHLRLLSVFHYVKGGITALFACIPIIHVVIGLVFILAPQIFGHGKDQPPAFLGWLFVILGSSFILLGWIFAALVLVAGRCISRRKHYTFCFVMACVECLSVPFGTVLGGVHDSGSESGVGEGVVREKAGIVEGSRGCHLSR